MAKKSQENQYKQHDKLMVKVNTGSDGNLMVAVRSKSIWGCDITERFAWFVYP